MSVWSDLLVADMALHEFQKSPVNLANVFAKRAMWEQAVIAYGRCFEEGTRSKLDQSVHVDPLGEEARATHQEIRRWRKQHVAHRSAPDLEGISTWIVYADDEPRARAIRIRLATSVGPDDQELPVRFGQLVKRLRDRLWEDHFPEYERQLVAEYDGDRRRWERSEKPPDESSGSRIVIALNPTGER